MLDIKDLKCVYDRVIFENVNINNISCGMNFIIGRSGCGKTSFINALIGLNNNATGSIMFNNKKIEDFTSFREKYVSVVFQEDNLIEYYTIKENLMMVNQDIKEIKYYLQKLKLLNKIDCYPTTLSGGERQRINIIRACLKHSYINIFDEPTSSVNDSLKEEIMILIKTLFKDKIVIIISHNQLLVNKYADRVIDLENNKDVLINKIEESNLKQTKFNPPLLKLNLISYKKRNVLPMVVITLVYIIVLSTLSLFDGINRYVNYNLEKKIDHNYFYIIKDKNDELSMNDIRYSLKNNLDIVELNDYRSYLYNNHLNDILFNNAILTEYYEIHIYEGNDKIVINNQLNDLIDTNKMVFMGKTYEFKIIDDGKLYTTPNIYFDYSFLYSLFGDIENNDLFFKCDDYHLTYEYLRQNYDNFYTMNCDYQRTRFDNSTILINESLKPLLNSIHSLVVLLSYSVVVMAIAFIKTLIDYNIRLRNKEINVYNYFGLKKINIIPIYESIILTSFPLIIAIILFIYLSPLINKLSLLLLDEFFPMLQFNLKLFIFITLIVLLINIIIIYGNRFNKHKQKLSLSKRFKKCKL